jgi:hypothetical protein
MDEGIAESEVMTRSLESRVRRKAARAGYVVRKRRGARTHENHGEYQLVDNDTGFPAFGFRYDASLQEIERWLAAEPTDGEL